MKLFFFSIVFIAFGLGVKLTQITDGMSSGFIFLGFGFILLILSVLTRELQTPHP